MKDDLDLSQLPHAQLYQMRGGIPEEEQRLQNKVAAAEHRAFARESTAERGVLNALSLGVAIPAYTAAKMLAEIERTGLPLVDVALKVAKEKDLLPGKARSEPSASEVIQGYYGLGEGLLKYATGTGARAARDDLDIIAP
jgi:hypothetical protein